MKNATSIKKTEGLSMIELLATISILVSVIMVITVLGNRAVSQSALFSVQTQAIFLAKEGMEIVTIKDNRDAIKTETLNNNKHWNADYVSGVSFVTEENCKNKLRINSDNFYTHSSGSVSIFSRCITSQVVGSGPPDDELRVKVNVYFNYKGEEQVVTLYRIFYD